MIVVDTSALMAILLGEPEGMRCGAALEAQSEVMISAGTLTEALIVAERRNIAAEMTALVEGLGIDVVAVSAPRAAKVADAYGRWGKGVHSAALNFGDCFAYALAQAEGDGLLFKGDDFPLTDILRA